MITKQEQPGAQEPSFVPSPRVNDLKRLSVRGGAATFVGQGATFIINTASTMVLARLLTPQDFGLVAMVTAVTGFAAVFKDLGLSYATIQRREITHTQVSNLFWLNTLMGVLLTLLTVALAPLVARFYHRSELTPVMIALAPTFLLSGLAIQHNALLSRQMRFVVKATIHITAVAIGTLVAILAALCGWRHWAIVSQSLVVAIVSLVGTWLASGWRPGWVTRNTGTRAMTRYGLNVTGFDVANYFARNLDNVLIGRYCGSSALGHYSKAYQLLMLPISQIRGPLNAVAMPALSRLQDSPEQYRAYYNRMLAILAFVSMPLVVFTYACAEELVYLFLGRQWGHAISLFQILAFVAFIQPVASTWGLLLMSSGRGTEYFRWGVFNAVVTSLGFAIGVRWGTIGVATAYVITNYALLYPALWYTCRRSPVRISDFFRVIARPAGLSLLMGVATTVVRTSLGASHDLLIVLAGAATSILAYLILWVAIPGGTRELREYAGYTKLVLRRKE